MKKNIIYILSIILAAGCAMGCSKEKKTSKNTAVKKVAANVAEGQLPNYRYVDIDTILSKYNLAIDYSEEMLKMQSQLESEARRHDNSIKSFAQTMQNKYQNNQYTEDSYNKDTQKMQQMQANAQSAVEKLQQSAAQSAMEADKIVQDSIHNFIEHYNASHHYDAILLKAATLYIDPALDITDEVVEGLNARYNKKEKK